MTEELRRKVGELESRVEMLEEAISELSGEFEDPLEAAHHELVMDLASKRMDRGA